MKQHTPIVLAATLLLVSGSFARGDFVAELWGNAGSCHHKETLKITNARWAEFDLSALPAAAAIQRAVLRASFQRHDYRQTILIHAVPPGANEADETSPPLALRAPWFNSFDATDAVRAARKAGAPLRLVFKAAPGWQSQSTVLEIAYQSGSAGQATPLVSGLRAVHHDGQTFLTWREHQDVMGEDPVTLEKMEEKLLPLRKQGEVAYRVYAHDKPITAESLTDATLLAEVPLVLSAYYLDSVETIEHPNRDRGEGSTPFVPGARARRQTVPRYVIAKGEAPLPRGSGLYVRTISKDAATYYAVITAVAGREAVVKNGLGPGNSLEQPVAERVAPPILVMQKSSELKNDHHRPAWLMKTYNYWLEFPYANVPRQLQFGTREPLDLAQDRKHLLWVQLGAYGSQAIFNAAQRGGGDIAICPPWDIDDSILQGRHECLETLKSYDQGVVHNWAQRRTLALVEWALHEWPINPQRICVEGQFALWALRHPEVFAGVIGDAYGNFSKGREAQKHGFSWGPYPEGRHNFAGVDQWDYMNIAKFVREHPTLEMPYYVSRPTTATHVGDMGPWAWPELFRALHDTKRAFAARWGGPWAGAPHAAVMLGRIQRNQSLPAFANCSLDDCPGDGELNPAGVGGDGDPQGDINGWLLWDTTDIVDEPARWEMTLYLPTGDKEGRGRAPVDSCTTDLTPRRCQKFKGFKTGALFQWTNTSLSDGKIVGQGIAKVDQWGLVTVEGLRVTKGRNRIAITQ